MRRTNYSSSLYFVLRREAQEEGHSKTRNLDKNPAFSSFFLVFIFIFSKIASDFLIFAK